MSNVYLFFSHGNIRPEYMQYTLPVAVIILLLLMICIYAHFIRRIDSFGVNAGYYLSGDGNWAGQMQPAAASADGNTGLVPVPLTGQQNSYLRGDGKWIQANNAPTAAHYLFTTTVSDQDTGIADTYLIKYPTSGYSVISSNSTVITQPNVSAFVLQPGYVYKCMAGITLATDAGTYINAIQFFSTTGVAYGVPGSILGTTAADTDHLCTNSTAIAYIAPTTLLAINVLFTNRAKANNILTGLVSAYATSRFAPISGGTWVSIEVISNNNTITAFTGSTDKTDGFIGYIPTPKAGQQNYVLTGGGNWVPPSILTYTNARIDGLATGSNLKFTALSTSPTCPAPFVLTNPTTFTSPNISGNYKIDIVINNFATVTSGDGIITPVIGGVPSRATITGSQIPNVPGGLSGMVILPIPANTTLSFSLSNVFYTYSGGTITIVSL